MKRGRQKVPDESLPKISAIFEEAFSFLKHPFFFSGAGRHLHLSEI
jgi:hypothetical protein